MRKEGGMERLKRVGVEVQELSFADGEEVEGSD